MQRIFASDAHARAFLSSFRKLSDFLFYLGYMKSKACIYVQIWYIVEGEVRVL